MPSRTPPPGKTAALLLSKVGRRLRARRKGLGVSAVEAAEAAGMSRVTLHRIERGEPSVAAGAYANLIAALGAELELAEARTHSTHAAAKLPATLRVADYPQLRKLAWQRRRIAELSPGEALSLYERNWRHVDREKLGERERALIQALAEVLGGGQLLV
ncbi:MAG: helix-turn-helix domain-containing protein [Deltaproteobacteria bacterium]|nr:helix-turn-helix domain-containing protein [Deltaproteobacteria bacterium]